MTPTTYVRMRQASEAGLISEILMRMSKDAKRTRNAAARVGRISESAGELTRRALRDLDVGRRSTVVREP